MVLLSFERRKALVGDNPDYGEVLCFCEDVTKAEVLEAIRRGAVTIDGVKRRTGTGMGRYRNINVVDPDHLGIPESAVWKDGPGSEIVRAAHENM